MGVHVGVSTGPSSFSVGARFALSLARASRSSEGEKSSLVKSEMGGMVPGRQPSVSVASVDGSSTVGGVSQWAATEDWRWYATDVRRRGDEGTRAGSTKSSKYSETNFCRVSSSSESERPPSDGGIEQELGDADLESVLPALDIDPHGDEADLALPA